MKIYNSKAQWTVNGVALFVFLITAFLKMNTSYEYAVARYDFSGYITKGIIFASVTWIVLTVICSLLTERFLDK